MTCKRQARCIDFPGSRPVKQLTAPGGWGADPGQQAEAEDFTARENP
jgi:hypothetical protein